ncbi:pentapeptide repeat-containing protein [Allosaccharopolyspora coralli]|uniref:Pentapeptide repeat-containing protein n=1 Tax=Allosaccharopolyspora coralli TaxID=2665642 RepID=A0A5Q3QC53_9PSEU|nr:pentapeptide repeat-containing protein [Allosaccharopolyspora coralli]QGK72032.1 pentapeptide repeat-containing protein [Allosaccharopolyspora coralli]
MRRELRADCGSCAGLCCVAPAFAASADFAVDKPAGQPCRNLLADCGCGIHDRLRDEGFPGCAVFDCFGAGQHVTQVTFGGRTWRDDASTANSMFAVFALMRQLHELLWYLAEADTLVPDGPLRESVRTAARDCEDATRAGADTLAAFDIAAYRQRVRPVLDEVSESARAGARGSGRDRVGADLIGRNLRRADLRGVSLRGSYLLGADLREVSLYRTDLLGADLRAADVRGARLDTGLFVTQPQLEAARGNAATTIPDTLTRPAHWRR